MEREEIGRMEGVLKARSKVDGLREGKSVREEVDGNGVWKVEYM